MAQKKSRKSKEGGPNRRPFVEPEFSEDAPIEELVDDGMLIATAGVRMAVKNLILVRTLRDAADFDEDWYVGAVTHEYLALAAEKADDAQRVTKALDKAKNRRGRARTATDYRTADAPLLSRRQLILTTLADRLTEASTDREIAENLVHEARDAALEEIASAVQSDPVEGYTGARRTDPDYEIDRILRLQLLDEDIDALRDAKWKKKQQKRSAST